MERPLDLLEREARVDEAVEVDASGCGQCDRGRIGVRVAEGADERELSRLQRRDRDPRFEARPHPNEHRSSGGPEREDAVTDQRLGAGAFEQHVERPIFRLQLPTGQVDGTRRSKPGGPLQSLEIDVGDDHRRRSGGPGGLHAQVADRSGTGDEHAAADADAPFPARPDPDRERLEQRPRIVGQLIGKRERVVLVDRDVASERSVDRWRCVEADVAAQVVAALATLRAAAAGNTGLERHTLTDVPLHCLRTAIDNDSGDLMTENERLLDDERADPAVLVVVHV